MRHRRGDRKFGRNRGHRRGLFRNLITALLLHERIETTEAKGKSLRAIGDRMISLGIAGDLASRRRALAYIQDAKAVSHLFSEVAPLYRLPSGSPNATRAHGGYTRLIKTRVRYGDSASMVIVELTRQTEREKAKEPAVTKTDVEQPAKTAPAP